MSNRRLHFPKPIYTILPWIYVGIGVMVMYSLPNAIGYLSGMLVITAGVLVFLWRAVARSDRKRKRKRRLQKGKRRQIP